MTSAEKKLWYEVLRNKQFMDLRWLRQRPILSYIADFYCAQLRLVVEIDGESHAYQKHYDEMRTKELHQLGITVVRFNNRDVIENIDGVYERLSIEVEKLKS